MRLIYLLLLTISLVVPTTAQTSKRPSVDSIKLRIYQLEKIYQHRTDSLQRELVYFRAKEDYFANAVSDQANFFLAVFGSTLTILGILAVFVNLGYFRIQFKALKTDYTEQVNETIRRLEESNSLSVERLEELQKRAANESAEIRVHSASTLQQLSLILTTLGNQAAADNRLYSSLTLYALGALTLIKAHEVDPTFSTLEETQERVEKALSLLMSLMEMLEESPVDTTTLNGKVAFASFTAFFDNNIFKDLILSLNSQAVNESLYELTRTINTHISTELEKQAQSA
ncbi:hypothetical protein [Fibrella arboris]|uniref:hypothetical protein n=1 Tax=Fibrella arboris TaxID=3242486 RepID=UPI00351FCC18